MGTGAAILATLAVAAVVLLIVEFRTLADTIPDNHITATVRRAMNQPGTRGAIILFLLALAYLAGHLFWCECVSSTAVTWLM